MPYPNLLSGGGVFTYGDRDAINALISGQGILSQGNVFWVRPRLGLDTNDGKSPASAFQTLTAALAAATANQNDVVLQVAEGDAAGSTTNYLSAALDWNKDLVHLIGINAGPLYSQRSRIALVPTFAAIGPMVTFSANDCLIANIQFFMGVADTTPIGAVKVTGTRNHFVNCHFAGIGNAANDIAGAYSLRLAGASECLFERCQIGLDTIVRSAQANCELLIDTASARNTFDHCTLYAMIGHATNHPLVRLTGATAIDRTLAFKDCLFLNESVNYAIAQAGNFKLSAPLTQGFIILNNPYSQNSDNSQTAVKWDVGDGNQIALFNAPTPAADTAGLARMV